MLDSVIVVALLFLLAGYSTWEDLLASKKSQVWSISIRIRNSFIKKYFNQRIITFQYCDETKGLKKEKLKFYCSSVWPLYRFGNGAGVGGMKGSHFSVPHAKGSLSTPR